LWQSAVAAAGGVVGRALRRRAHDHRARSARTGADARPFPEDHDPARAHRRASAFQARPHGVRMARRAHGERVAAGSVRHLLHVLPADRLPAETAAAESDLLLDRVDTVLWRFRCGDESPRRPADRCGDFSGRESRRARDWTLWISW